MQALEVSQFRLITCFHQGLKTSLHEFRQTATQHSLLTEQVGFCLFLEVGLQNSGTGATDSLGIGHRHAAGVAGGVLFDGEQGGHALAILVLPTHGVARALRGDHHHIHIGGGLDQLETDVEAMGEAEHLACTQVGCDFLLVDVLLEFVGQQDHDPVGLG